MKRKVYVETSIISYLTARPSRTILGAAYQQLTRLWWERRFEYEVLVSQAVWQECAAGDPEAAQRRIAALEGLDALAITEEMIDLAEALIYRRLIPEKALGDALLWITELIKIRLISPSPQPSPARRGSKCIFVIAFIDNGHRHPASSGFLAYLELSAYRQSIHPRRCGRASRGAGIVLAGNLHP